LRPERKKLLDKITGGEGSNFADRSLVREKWRERAEMGWESLCAANKGRFGKSMRGGTGSRFKVGGGGKSSGRGPQRFER